MTLIDEHKRIKDGIKNGKIKITRKSFKDFISYMNREKTIQTQINLGG